MIVCIVGPTGIGKTELSLQLAAHYNTEIISGDSVQVYKNMDIGSAKVTQQEQLLVKHHLIDLYDITEQFSVAVYQQNVRAKIKEFNEKSLIPLIVGGTGLYIKSVLYDYNFEHALRDESLEEKYKDLDNQALYEVLLEKDPKQAENLHPNNRKRVLQAIGRSKSNKMSQNTSKDTVLYDYVMIGLTMDRAKLHKRIEKRVDQMLDMGLVDEVKELMKIKTNSYALDAIGYKEIVSYLKGETTLEEAREKIIIHTRQLAKKQYTFFNNQLNVKWIDKDKFTSSDALFKEATKIIDKAIGL